jgi:hypothetical protein
MNSKEVCINMYSRFGKEVELKTREDGIDYIDTIKNCLNKNNILKIEYIGELNEFTNEIIDQADNIIKVIVRDNVAKIIFKYDHYGDTYSIDIPLEWIALIDYYEGSNIYTLSRYISNKDHYFHNGYKVYVTSKNI